MTRKQHYQSIINEIEEMKSQLDQFFDRNKRYPSPPPEFVTLTNNFDVLYQGLRDYAVPLDPDNPEPNALSKILDKVEEKFRPLIKSYSGRKDFKEFDKILDEFSSDLTEHIDHHF